MSIWSSAMEPYSGIGQTVLNAKYGVQADLQTCFHSAILTDISRNIQTKQYLYILFIVITRHQSVSIYIYNVFLCHGICVMYLYCYRFGGIYLCASDYLNIFINQFIVKHFIGSIS